LRAYHNQTHTFLQHTTKLKQLENVKLYDQRRQN